MEWVFGAVILMMLALYIWAVAGAKRELAKRIQPYIDDLFGNYPKDKTSGIRAKAKFKLRR